MSAETSKLILAVNGGSSSLKFAVFQITPFEKLFYGKIERIGLSNTSAHTIDSRSKISQSIPISAPDHQSAAKWLIETLKSLLPGSIAGIGHRIVHGGSKYSGHEVVTTELLDYLGQLSPFDLDHLPSEIALLNLFRGLYPNVPHVACFDTVFHQTMPRVAQQIPIPRRFESKGVRRYGFHGLSYTFLVNELDRLSGHKNAARKIILCHLGSGASLCAVLDGQSLETTMGFTPNSGLPMGTRSGDLDPELGWFLARTENMDAARFHLMINRESGLLGISETSSDIRDLLAHENTDVRAAEAVDFFCYQIGKHIGALAAVLGGIDVVVFSGGIGENAAAIRKRTCEKLHFLGIDISDSRNEKHAPVISSDTSRVIVRVIPSDEETVIGEITCNYLSAIS